MGYPDKKPPLVYMVLTNSELERIVNADFPGNSQKRISKMRNKQLDIENVCIFLFKIYEAVFLSPFKDGMAFSGASQRSSRRRVKVPSL